MGRLTDRGEIRERLCADRVWSVYALGDLTPANFGKAQWFTPDLTLVYSDYGTCILFAMGVGSLDEALAAADRPVHLQVRPEAMARIGQLARVTRAQRMWRMAWPGGRPAGADWDGARRLTAADVPGLERLYADGAARGESPDFFFPSMVTEGVFFGVERDGAIVAAAGTHLYAPEEGAAAIGNVYTRRDWRGRGLGRVVTGAVTAALDGIETVGLNVRVDNAAAIRVYEGLGFRKHCEFYEGMAE